MGFAEPRKWWPPLTTHDRYKLNGVNMANLLGDVWPLVDELETRENYIPFLPCFFNVGLRSTIFQGKVS